MTKRPGKLNAASRPSIPPRHLAELPRPTAYPPPPFSQAKIHHFWLLKSLRYFFSKSHPSLTAEIQYTYFTRSYILEIAEILPFISLGSTIVAIVVAFMRVKQSSDESKNAIARIEGSIKERILSLEKRIDENDKLTNNVD